MPLTSVTLQWQVTAFLEKPGPEATQSRLACPCFYMFSPAALELLPVFLAERKDEPLVARDAPGNFVRYLSSKVGMTVPSAGTLWLCL